MPNFSEKSPSVRQSDLPKRTQISSAIKSGINAPRVAKD
jgi:hypothetical protein